MNLSKTINGGLGVSYVAMFLLVMLAVAGTTKVHGQTAVTTPKAKALFAFGDSYADTGNQNKNSSCWKPPSGIAWPGYPSGRFGNGHIQTDYIADVLGLPTPIPLVDSAVQGTENGINFAVGGSGVTFALGVPPLGSQVDNLELVVRTGIYSPDFLAESVALVSIVGNDYHAAPAYTPGELMVIIQQVVEGLALALGRLYEVGFRNVLVANLPPISCLPSRTIVFNNTACVESDDPSMAFHNNRLEEAVAQLNTLPSANFLILDEQKAFRHVLNNYVEYGIKEKLIPCCRPVSPTGNCGDVDEQGKPLYTVCDNPASYVYWDGAHPVESTWKHVVELFTKRPGYVLGAPTLEMWLYQNSLGPALAPSATPPGPDIAEGAISQLETAYDALISDPNYAESLGLLQAINLNDDLVSYPAQTVTVFLPNNIAYFSLPAAEIDTIYGQDQVLPVVRYHVVKGYYDSTQLVGSMKSLTTISELQLLVNSTSTAILVGLEAAMVVRPDLYKVEGQVVIHGIDRLLLPPNLVGINTP